MKKLIGLYIEDEPKNITMLQAWFELYSKKEIELVGVDVFPQQLNEFYDIVIDKNIDFLIVDHELDKVPVSYKGIDVLKEIRKNDRNIYAILLTNFSLDNYREELGEYDFQLEKRELQDPEKVKELVVKIKRACDLRSDNDILAGMVEVQKEEDALLQLLEQVKDRIDKD